MKNILLFLILLLVSAQQLHLFAQIEDIKSIPFQSSTLEYIESTPIIINDNELLIIYATNHKVESPYAPLKEDTVYTVRSFNAGKNWEQPAFIRNIKTEDRDKNKPFYLSALKISAGRILLCWSDWRAGKISIIHSDDNGLTWTDTTQIKGGGNVPPLQSNSLYNINLSELTDGRIILNFNSDFLGIAYYRVSYDLGETWSEEAYIFSEPQSSQPDLKDVSMIEIPTKGIIAFFEAFSSTAYSSIYKKISTDGGETWSEIIPVIDTQAIEKRPRIIKISDDDLWLIYEVTDTTEYTNQQKDIYYTKSFNGGDTWSEPQRFTNYVGEDQFVNAAKFSNDVFISFSSTRFTNQSQISFAKLGETIENFRPPYIMSVNANSHSLEKNQWHITAEVIDDEAVASVEVSFDDGTFSELFDDGQHNDGVPLDNIFANTVLFNSLPPSKENVIDVNKLMLPINNKGELADVRVKLTQNSVFTAVDNVGDKCEFETTLENTLDVWASYDEGVYLFSGGFFLSGYTDGELWSNAVALSNLVLDYSPGNVGSDRFDPLNKIYSVQKSDLPFGYSWQKWKDAVSLGAEFYDGDSDGVYNPVDKNWNGTWEQNEDMPMIIGDVTAWCVYNDGVPKTQRRWNTVEPQGIEVRQTIFASNNSELEEVIFIRYSVLNTGTACDVMDSVYFGVWEDADLGDYSDDVVGCDTLLNSGFYYNNTHDGIYGDNQPSFFTTILQGPVIQSNRNTDTATVNYGTLIGQERTTGLKNLDMSSHVFFVGGDPLVNDPGNKIHVRNYLEGRTKLGDYPDPCNFWYCEVRGGVNCSEVDPHFWASGDPVTDVGWISRMNVDSRNLVSTGPFKLEKDKPQEIIIAYVMGRGTGYFNSITVARENVRKAIAEYQSNFASMTYTSPPPTNPVTEYILYHNYPNPFNPTTTIRYEIPHDGVVTIKVYDILGQEVTTLLNEFKKADRYEFNFDAVGLASGVYIYRMKVNDFIESKKMILLR